MTSDQAKKKALELKTYHQLALQTADELLEFFESKNPSNPIKRQTNKEIEKAKVRQHLERHNK